MVCMIFHHHLYDEFEQNIMTHKLSVYYYALDSLA